MVKVQVAWRTAKLATGVCSKNRLVEVHAFDLMGSVLTLVGSVRMVVGYVYPVGSERSSQC